MLSEFVDGTDAGMFQCGSRACLALKASEGPRILNRLFGQELECYLPSQSGVLSPVHQAHSAAAQPAQNVVMRNVFARQGESDVIQPTAYGSLHGIACVSIAGK